MNRSNDSYAIPALKKLPIHDREHILMAASAINNVTGITEEQRIDGRIAIAIAADRLGINAKAAKCISISMEAMAIALPTVDGHPNRLPFSGIMTRVDVASDFPVGGTTSKKVLIPKSVAEAGLPSLLGMAIGYTPNFDSHDRKSKLGIITEAFIGDEDLVLGTPLHIAGFFYAADFPDEVAFIQANRDELGFSYEASALIESMTSDPWVCTLCTFTGAAILKKDKAAFTATSIHASKGADSMTPEEIAAMQKQNAELAASNEAALAKIKKMEAEAAIAALEASSVQDLVKPHADALRACATAMIAAGIGAHATYGHGVILNKMADHMEAASILGKIPDTFDSYYYGSKTDAVAVEAAISTATAPFADTIASMQTKLDDADKQIALLSAGKAEIPTPERKSLSASSVLTKIGLSAEGVTKLTVAQVDAACSKAGMKSQDSMALKLSLRAAGSLE